MAPDAAGAHSSSGGGKGLSVQQASRDTATVPGFQQALRNQRATLLQFAQLWPDEIRIEKRGTQNIMRARARGSRAQSVRRSQTLQQQSAPGNPT